MIFIFIPFLLSLLRSVHCLLNPLSLVYSLGYQWAWSFNLSFTLCFTGAANLIVKAANSICSFDHYIISSFFLRLSNVKWISNCSSYFNFIPIWSCGILNQSVNFGYHSIHSFPIFLNQFNSFYAKLRSFSDSFGNFHIESCFYLFDINRFLIIPLWTSFKIIVFSFDVIHSLGFYCFGIKIDAIPGRINLASTLRSLFKGEHRGFCFELCGQGHSSMLIVGLILKDWFGVRDSIHEMKGN